MLQFLDYNVRLETSLLTILVTVFNRRTWFNDLKVSFQKCMCTLRNLASVDLMFECPWHSTMTSHTRETERTSLEIIKFMLGF